MTWHPQRASYVKLCGDLLIEAAPRNRWRWTVTMRDGVKATGTRATFEEALRVGNRRRDQLEKGSGDRVGGWSSTGS